MQNAKTPRSGKREVLVDINSLAAFDTVDLTKNLAEVQTNFVARRTRLHPAVAKVVAELAFENRRAA